MMTCLLRLKPTLSKFLVFLEVVADRKTCLPLT